MAAATFAQTSFAGGAWSKFAGGRADHPDYRRSMAVCENSFPLVSGAWTRRPGTRSGGYTRGGAQAAILPFAFQDNLPYTIELTDSHLRFFQGAAIVTGGSNWSVSSISSASPAVVTTGVAHGYASADQVLFTPSDVVARGTLPLLFGRLFSIVVISSTTFSIADALTGKNIDGSLLGWISTLNLTVDRVIDLASPYLSPQVDAVRGVQNETNMVLLHQNVFPQSLDATPPSGMAPATFTIADAPFVDGPYLDPLTNGLILTATSANGLVNMTLGAQTYDATTAYSLGDIVLSSGVTYQSLIDQNVGNTPASVPTAWAVSSPAAGLNGGAGFTSADFGRHIRLFSEPAAWVTGTTYTAGNVVKFDGSYWAALAGMAGATPAAGDVNPNQPGLKSTTWALSPASGRWTWGKITGLGTSGLISQTLAGSAVIAGFWTNPSKAIDGNLSEPAATAARFETSQVGNTGLAYIGRSFAGSSVISSAVVYPTSDLGLNFGGGIPYSLVINLRGKNSAPSSATDGTLLGTVTVATADQTQPITIISTDQTSTWSYVWLDFSNLQWNAAVGNQVSISEMEFYSGTALAGTTVTVQILGEPLLFASAISTWRLGLFNARDAVYPTNGCYAEGRLWLAGAVENRFDASRSNEPFNFSPTEDDGSVPDNAAISYTLNGDDLNQIAWMLPDRQGIIAGTTGGEWIIESPAGTTAGFAPRNIAARRATKYGCASFAPQRTGMTTVFVQRATQELHEFLADAYSGKFVGPTLTEMNRRATKSGIRQLAYQINPAPVVWTRLGNGNLAGVSYRRVSMISTQPPEINAWHEHTLGSGYTLASMAGGPSVDGSHDTLSMVTYDAATGLYQLEALGDFFDEDDSLFSAAFVDSGISPSSGATVSGNIRLYGLWPMNGKSVDVWLAGLDCGTFTVVNGYVDVPLGSAGGLLTQRWMTQLSATAEDFGWLATSIDQSLTVPAVVGFSFRSRGQLLRPIAQDQTGSQLGPAFGKLRREDHIAILFHQAQGVSVGTDFDDLKPAIFATEGDRLYTPTELFSGMWRDALQDGYSFDSQLCWEVSRPYPLTVAAVGGFIKSQN